MKSSRFSGIICPVADRIPIAIGKSKAEPVFLTSAGAKFTVTRLAGNKKPAFLIAADTLSFASLTAPSGKPTVLNAGSWGETSTSTSTMYASIPSKAEENTLDNIDKNIRTLSIAVNFKESKRGRQRRFSPGDYNLLDDRE
jgi:hypothetical protein